MELKEIISFEDNLNIFEFNEHEFVKKNNYCRYSPNGDVLPYAFEIVIDRIKYDHDSGDIESYSSNSTYINQNDEMIELISILEHLYDDIQLKNAILKLKNSKEINDSEKSNNIPYIEFHYDLENDNIPLERILNIDSSSFEKEIINESKLFNEYMTYLSGWLIERYE